MKIINFKFINRIKNKNCIEGGLRLLRKGKKNPIFSIITVNLNDDLESTILSIKKQKFRNIFEHIIVDGGSRKGYLKLLKSYNNIIDYWISEKDNGIWDASNKGILLSKGKFIGILDSGDILSKDASEILKKLYLSNKNADCIVGSVLRSRLLSGFYPNKIKTHLNIIPSNSGGFFVKRSMQKRVGLFDESYKCHADYDMVYKMLKLKKLKYTCSQKYEILSKKSPEGFSSNYGFLNLLSEEVNIRIKNQQNFIYVYLLALGKILNKIKNNLIKFDGNKFINYKYDYLVKKKIKSLNKFYEYIQTTKKFKKI